MSVKVSVLLPVHNGELFLNASIRSMLDQSYSDFELIILDDGSTDTSANIVREFQKNDARIKLISLPKSGLATTLNTGLDLAKGEFLARMDADDVCLPDRLSRQVEYLDAHPLIGACGSWMESFGEKSARLLKYPCSSEDIKCAMVFYNPIPHPTVMIRREILHKYHLRYNEEYLYAQDYLLWLSFLKVSRIENLPQVLVKYRIHAGQISREKLAQQNFYAQSVRKELLLEMVPPEILVSYENVHEDLCNNTYKYTRNDLLLINRWLKILINNNKARKFLPHGNFLRLIQSEWFEVCRKSKCGVGFYLMHSCKYSPKEFMRSLNLLFNS